MPENEIPPAMRVDIYLFFLYFKCKILLKTIEKHKEILYNKMKYVL